MTKPSKTLSGTVIDESVSFTLEELCSSCDVSQTIILELVEFGIIEPLDIDNTTFHFSNLALNRSKTALRLQQDLDINLAGIALALDLMDEIDALRRQLQTIQQRFKQFSG